MLVIIIIIIIRFIYIAHIKTEYKVLHNMSHITPMGSKIHDVKIQHERTRITVEFNKYVLKDIRKDESRNDKLTGNNRTND